jgi:hypothetical protein
MMKAEVAELPQSTAAPAAKGEEVAGYDISPEGRSIDQINTASLNPRYFDRTCIALYRWKSSI